mmetsp:Transcript_5895/g.16830  ORF Transcript_5895/g.16830 Transcript_5895/m.16830 type:complete len:320 (-) Transcript_5895:147-1106(-)
MLLQRLHAARHDQQRHQVRSQLRQRRPQLTPHGEPRRQRRDEQPQQAQQRRQQADVPAPFAARGWLGLGGVASVGPRSLDGARESASCEARHDMAPEEEVHAVAGQGGRRKQSARRRRLCGAAGRHGPACAVDAGGELGESVERAKRARRMQLLLPARLEQLGGLARRRLGAVRAGLAAHLGEARAKPRQPPPAVPSLPSAADRPERLQILAPDRRRRRRHPRPNLLQPGALLAPHLGLRLERGRRRSRRRALLERAVTAAARAGLCSRRHRAAAAAAAVALAAPVAAGHLCGRLRDRVASLVGRGGSGVGLGVRLVRL